MKFPSYLPAALAASLALLAQGSAMAAGTASATISNVQFGVLDLTPNDGIAASYNISEFSSRLYANVWSGTENVTKLFYADPYVPATAGYERGSSYVWSTSGGAIGELGANAAGYQNLEANTRLTASTLQEISLTLRPYSMLTVGGHFSALVERTPAGGMNFSSSGQTSAEIQSDEGDRSSAGRYFSTYPGDSASEGWEQDFMLTYGNNSNHDIQLSLTFYTTAGVLGPMPGQAIAAVPEPETWAMLGAGLALVGFAAKRRRLPTHERPA